MSDECPISFPPQTEEMKRARSEPRETKTVNKTAMTQVPITQKNQTNRKS